ncbi:hypothetical protein DFQ27_001391 [Actinomortierella ambigua]|uniref:FAR1 domain-containing protein n=1 Tax=Actinomortierella ambigua TaxID=1343610 RepID=A0A9P6QDC3_9FUNG|nr:hypothetical protein DFQ27_001391 [Actinomortierella ambigua]
MFCRRENVYLYCSREGVPDSVKNNKEIKRKRLSMRCDCKWRITLFQQESKQWVFRKAMNPASMVHNHPLTSPDDIRQPWPQGVFDRISFYANQRNLTTAETRERIKEEFPDLVWDERRFYNRLTEERKQIKLRDSETRVFSTMDLAAKVASLASADPTLSYKVTSSLENVLVEICEQLRIDPAGASSRVITSPPPSAGGGGGGGGSGSGGGISVGSSSLGAAMSMTSPTTTSPNYPSSSASSPLSSSDYVVTYPGCVISVKNTPTQKGRPSSTSSPVVDPSLAVGLGMSPLNDRKRSLSEECFSRPGIPPPPGASTAFGMGASHMMTSLDGSMQQLAQQQQQQQQHHQLQHQQQQQQQQQQHSHLAHHHHGSMVHQQQQQQNQQQQQQQQQQQLQHQGQSFTSMQPSSLPPQPPPSQQPSTLQQAQHAAHQHSLAALDQSLVSGAAGVLVLPPGSYGSSHGPHSSPGRHSLHHGHSQMQQASTHPFGQSSMSFHPTDTSSPSMESPFEGGDQHMGGHPGLTAAAAAAAATTNATIRRSHSVEIKQEVQQPYFQQLLPALVPQRRSGSSPGPGSAGAGNIAGGGQSNRIYPGGPYTQSVGQSSSSSSSSSSASSVSSSVAMGAAGSTAPMSAVPYSEDVFGSSSTGFPVSSEPYAYGSQPPYPTA